MKTKKLVTLLLCIVMLCGILPISSAAEDTASIIVGGTEVVNSTSATYWLNDATTGGITAEGATADNYNVMYDGDGMLTLNNAAITKAYNGYFLGQVGQSTTCVSGITANCALNLVLIGDNTVTVPASSTFYNIGMFCEYSLTISGTGALTLASASSSDISRSMGLYSYYGPIEITSGSLTCISGDAGWNSIGIQVGFDSLTISGGSVSAVSGEAEASTTVYTSAKAMNITGGSITAESKSATGKAFKKQPEFGTENPTWYQWRVSEAGEYTLSADKAYTLEEGNSYVSICPIPVDETVIGDFNDDKAVNMLDAVELVGAVVNRNKDKKYDFNDDGRVNYLDVIKYVEYLCEYYPEVNALAFFDVNDNGKIDAVDVLMIVFHFRSWCTQF